MTDALIVTASIVYIIVGLFCSRWWWRRDVAPDSVTSQIAAVWIVFLWPIWLIGIPVFAFVTWFYGTPMHRSEDQ